MANKRAVIFEDTAEEWEGIPSQMQNHLMIIGINKYKDTDIKSLSNAQTDAKQVKDLLTKWYGFEADKHVVLYDEAASLKNITFHLRQLSTKIKEKDSLLIYFAGHGYLDKTTNIAYLIPADAKKGEIDTYLPNSTVLDLIRAIKSLHTFLVLDSCFSGALLRKRDFEDSEALAENMEKYPSRIVLAAGMIETVSDGYYKENSPFAKAFMKRLENNTQRKLPASELIQFVKKAVPGNAKQQPCSGTLFDTGDLQGEFVFYRTDGISPVQKTNMDVSKTEYRESEVDKNFVEKMTHFFQNNKITGSIVLIGMLIIGIGGVIEGVKSMRELGQADKKDTVFVKNVQEIGNPTIAKADTTKKQDVSTKAEPQKKPEPIVKEPKSHTPETSVQPITNSASKTVTTPKEKPLPEKNEPQYFEATLTVNASFSKAEIFIDGKPAEILSNTLTVKKIRIPAGNHTITLKANGKECSEKQFISSNSTLVMTCK